MKKWKAMFAGWLFRIEHEVMLPFIAVGIAVTGAFGAISCYSGYTIQMEEQKTRARLAFQNIRVDFNYLSGRITEEELEEKYGYYQDPAVRITTEDGRVLTGPETVTEDMRILRSETVGEGELWRLEYILDMDQFFEGLLREQKLVIVGAVASLLVIVEVSVFLAWYLTKPIRNMSATCREIEQNRKDFRKYRFDAVRRKDEIGQLARTFETLLRNMDNYTKMEYTSRMSATLAHEIKNPLTGIRSGVQVLKGRVEKPGDRLLCDGMVTEIDRVTGLINNLFTLSVKRESPREVISVPQFFGEMEAFYGKGLRQQGISFGVKLTGKTEAGCGEEAAKSPAGEGDGGLTLWANENELRQILHNLMTNSLKALKEKEGGEVILEAEELEDQTEIRFRDNGRGMDPEELSRAMEPFYTKSINGVGIGLAIVSRLTEQNGGTMDMESAPGRGTTVRLRFGKKGENHEEGTDC